MEFVDSSLSDIIIMIAKQNPNDLQSIIAYIFKLREHTLEYLNVDKNNLDVAQKFSKFDDDIAYLCIILKDAAPIVDAIKRFKNEVVSQFVKLLESKRDESYHGVSIRL